MTYIGIIFTYAFISNFVLTQFLGICPFIGVSKNVEPAIGMGFAVTFVMAIASLVTWFIQQVLVTFNIEYLQIITFILVIAALVQLVEMIIQKISTPLYKALGIYLPLITTNCAVLGIAILSVQNDYNAIESLVAGFAAGFGFLIAILLMATIREKLDTEWVPKPLRGVPITFISGGLMALGFMAFDRALLANLFPTL
jgi:electron transport complex protein RnfA